MESISVIIPVKNEEEKIGAIINETKKLNPLEIITVVNGSNDKTKEVAASLGCKIIEYNESLGHDIGRAIGAYHARGDILLFLDGDMLLNSSELQFFIEIIKNGYDIGLNNLKWYMDVPSFFPDGVSLSKKALSDLCNRPDISMNSLVAVPHSMNRRALDKIGWINLAIPPLALAIAIKENLSIAPAAYIDVVTPNKYRPEIHSIFEDGLPFTKSVSWVIGDHLEAIHSLIQREGVRGGFPTDSNRSDNIHDAANFNQSKKGRSVVLTLDTELKEAESVIETIKSIGTEEIIVVLDYNQTFSMSKLDPSVKIIKASRKLGLFEARVLGAFASSGETILFMDDSIINNSEELELFFTAIEKGNDIALNNVLPLIHQNHPIDPISSIQYFLNMALKKPDIYNCSFIFTPFAISHQVLEKIGCNSLMIPPLAHVKAFQQHDFKVSLPHSVLDQVVLSKFIQEKEIILGDFYMAFHQLLTITDSRGGFPNGSKAFHVLNNL